MSIILKHTDYKYILDWDEPLEQLKVLTFSYSTWNQSQQQYDMVLSKVDYVGPLYGSWYSTISQYAVAANTASFMTCNETAEEKGIVRDGNHFKVLYRGIYNMQFSAQVDKTSAASEHIYIWFRKNGVDVPYSASEVGIQGSLAETIPSWNFIFNLEANDYIDIMYSVTNIDVHLKAVAPNAIPGIPSVIVTMFKV